MSHPKRKLSEEDCALFNKLREENNGKVLNFTEVRSLFSSNFKNGLRVFRKLINGGILTKVGRGKYRFPDKPVYYKLLQAAWEKEEIEKAKTPEKTLDEEIEDAILLLSDNGYKIYKGVFDMEKAMKSPDKSVASFLHWEEVL